MGVTCREARHEKILARWLWRIEVEEAQAEPSGLSG